jgi:hypothetical protein
MSKILIDEAVVRGALKDLEVAQSAIGEWGSYASAYFQEKHGLADDIEALTISITALRQALEQPAPAQEPVAWEAPSGVGLKRFVSDRLFNLFSAKVRAFYKPYRCANCVTTSEPTPPAPAPALQENTYAYAGVKIWIGDDQVSHFISRTAIEKEAVKGMRLHMAADWCLQELKERT